MKPNPDTLTLKTEGDDQVVLRRDGVGAQPPRVSNPLVITANDDGWGKATLFVPWNMRIRTIRAYTADPAGLRVCRLGMKPTGDYGTKLWSPLDESTELLPPLEHVVETPDFPCAWAGTVLKGGHKYDFEIQALEGGGNFSVELTIFADPDC